MTKASKIVELQDILVDLGPEGHLCLQQSDMIASPKAKYDFMLSEARRIGDKIEFAIKYKEKAVDIRTFVEDPYYLNMANVFFPKVMEELEELNSGKYVEAVLTGGIGTGKTTVAIATTAYQLYLLSLLKNPHAEFGIAPGDEIVVIFQSISAKLAKSVDYERFQAWIDKSPYFNEKFLYDKSLKSEMKFPNRIIVKPVSGQDTGAIGQNVIGGIMDEVNFMAVIENSKMNHDGGTYDQAWQNYRAIARRRESRFMKQGKVPGMLCLVSSKRYPGEFTEVKAKEANTNKRIFVYDKRVWDIKPPETFMGPRFNVFIGDANRKPKLIGDKDKISPADRHLVISVPIEYKPSFDQDILASLRDIAGVSTLALHPFMTDIERVSACFGTTTSLLSQETCNFKETNVLIYPKRVKSKEKYRFAHIDLGVTSDSAGIACGYVDGFVKVPRGDFDFEILPKIIIDFVLEVEPPKNEEIKFWKIREMLYRLREIGCPIKWVTFDTFQSTDMVQILRQKGFVTGIQSMDVDNKAYDVTKSALMDGRILLPEHSVLYNELIHLERDPKKNKIDHPPKGSKDCADALAGVIYGLTMRKEIWLEYDIPLSDIPSSITNAGQKPKNSIESQEAKDLIDDQDE